MADTNIGIPYWDWTNDSSVPDVWEDILSPIKDHTNSHYRWQEWDGWKNLLKYCINAKPSSGPQTHSVRIRKDVFEEIKKQYVTNYEDKHLQYEDPLSHYLKESSDI